MLTAHKVKRLTPKAAQGVSGYCFCKVEPRTIRSNPKPKVATNVQQQTILQDHDNEESAYAF